MPIRQLRQALRSFRLRLGDVFWRCVSAIWWALPYPPRPRASWEDDVVGRWRGEQCNPKPTDSARERDENGGRS